jgi:purine-binding chemotaxis protein CheW
MSSTNNTVSAPDSAESDGKQTDLSEFVTMIIGDQWFGIPVYSVQDVLGSQDIALVPLAPPDVAGSLNLRGRIVTAIDPRVRLGLPARDKEKSIMSIVVEHGGELYSLLIDQVGEVLNLPVNRFERNPASLDPRWRDISAGVYRLDDRLLVVMDVDRLLEFETSIAA